jgi:hypothetical protein
MGEGELELCLPSPKDGRGAGGEGKDLSLHWDAPTICAKNPKISDKNTIVINLCSNKITG